MIKGLLLVLVGVALTTFLNLSQRQNGPLTVSGFIEADEIRIGSRVGGRVLNVAVDEGTSVTAGQVLVELEPFDLLERKAEAEQGLAEATARAEQRRAGYRPEEIAQAAARRKQIEAETEKLRNGPRPEEIRAAEANLRLAESELQLAIQEFQRIEELYGKQAADRSQLDEAGNQRRVRQARFDAETEALAVLRQGTRKEDLQRAEAQLEEAEQELILRQKGYREEEIREAESHRDAAKAAVAAVQRQIDELQIRAPSAAVVEALELRPGDLLAPNAPAISLADPQRLWVRAYIPENHLHLKNGQELRVRVDSFPDQTFRGVIVFVARQAEFTPSSIQTAEQRSRQVFRIKVALEEGLDVLRPGMAADVILE